MPSRSQPELVIFVGLQGSGKTSFFQEHFRGTHQHVSKDLIRNARRKNERQAALVLDALKKGHSVVVDNTNARKSDRAALIELGRAQHARVIVYYFEPDISSSMQRNSRRHGSAHVPAVAIYATAKHLEAPSPDEGMDEVFQVRTFPGPLVSVKKVVMK